MPSNSTSMDNSIIAEEHPALRDAASSNRATDVLGGENRKPKAAPASGDALLEKIAAELYGISSMLLGEGEEAVGLIEGVVANVDLPTCCDTAEAHRKARLLLAADAITVIGQRDSSANAALAAPGDDSGPAGCIEDDDLSAAGVTPDELERMITGPEHHRLRDWLEGLSDSLRVIFVLRAIAALTSVEVAGLLSKYGGPSAKGWTPEAVRSSFRQALCSLASQLIHATAAR
jgi:hypothetical protein